MAEAASRLQFGVGMAGLLRPRVFLSYARRDMALADRLLQHLQAQGCTVWMDRSELLTGDDFVRGIQREIPRCDGLIFLLTKSAAASSWCLAEVQRALAIRLPVLVVQHDRSATLPDALERVLRDVQRADWVEFDVPPVGRHLRSARRRRLVRLAQRVAMISLPVLLSLSAVVWGVSSLNERQIERARVDAFEALRGATSALSGTQVRARLGPFSKDEVLTQRFMALAADPTATPIVRLNAWQATDALREGHVTEWRAYVPAVDWSGGRLSGAVWANVTYGAGTIEDLIGHQLKIAGVVLGAGPSTDSDGLSLVRTSIYDSDIWYLRVDGTQLLDVQFVNSKFRGAQLDLSGAAGVRFLSLEQSEHFISTDVGIIEDSWIVQRRALPGPDVLDLAEPEQEILFDGIQFHRTRFDGEFKPAWFRNSHFTDCTFPPGLAASLAASGSNVIEGMAAFEDEGVR